MAGQAERGGLRPCRRRSGRYRERMSFRRILLALVAVAAIVVVRNAVADKGGSYDPSTDA